MKLFKQIDIVISLGLIGGFLAARCWNDFGLLLTAYFVVGGWHVISMLVHAATGCFTRKGGARHVYHWLTFIALVSLPLGSYWLMVFLAPLMAAYYTTLCIIEVRKMSERPLAVIR